MEGFKTNTHVLALIITMLACFLLSSVKGQNGPQINSPCTASMITSFTPCMNYVTGSSSSGSNGTSPSSDCCDAMKSLMGTSVDCTCMLMTANVPLPLSFINRTLALSLPRACNTGGIPVQCKATASPLPAPGPLQLGPTPPPASALSPQGPLQLGPTPPPASALSPQASKATASAPAAEPAATEVPPLASPPVEVAAAPTTIPRVRPVLAPSASSLSTISLPTFSLMFMGFMVFKLL